MLEIAGGIILAVVVIFAAVLLGPFLLHALGWGFLLGVAFGPPITVTVMVFLEQGSTLDAFIAAVMFSAVWLFGVWHLK